MTSRGGFVWPRKGAIAAPDFKPTKKCGAGLHGLLWGEGDHTLLSWDDDAVWLVVRVLASEIVDLGDKVKFPRGTVVYCGERVGAGRYVCEHGGEGKRVVSGTATAGDSGTATAGYRGTATAGDSGTATAGDSGTATAGDSGTATAGDSGTATAGYRGTATAGYSGTATAGDSGTATAGDSGTATAGEDGVISILLWNGERFRPVIGAIGEEGLLPNMPYKLDGAGKFVRADAQ